LLLALPLAAQPYGAYLVKGSGEAWVEVPNTSAFNFTTGFTFEAWVGGVDPGVCGSIAGKDFQQSWWVGVCGTTLRTYLKGGLPSQFNGGTIPANEFVHVAVTYDGAVRKHYIDGELVASHAETGAMPASSAAMRLNGDASWQHSYASTLDEVRLWNVARTQDEIRSTINTTITSPQPGLVAVYHLDGSPVDSIAGHNGTNGGSAAYLAPPVALTCGSTTSSQLCLTPNRFAATAKWLLPDGTRGVGTVVPGSNSTSGLFWFFGSDNWELLVKVIDGCPVNNNKWVFAAATTNVHYQLAVTDVKSGQTKRYFNYFGQSAPAVTDTNAFATCP
jgi:hypothetical protein